MLSELLLGQIIAPSAVLTITRNLEIILQRASHAVSVYRVVPCGVMEILPEGPVTLPISGSMESEEAPVTFHDRMVVSPGLIVSG